MKFLVTGGAGFIGSNLVDLLIGQGHLVEVWDNLSTGKEENINQNAFLRVVDISEDIDEMYLNNWDTIFHLAALPSIQDSLHNPEITNKVNVNGTVNILEVARKTGSKVIYAGSSSVYFDPLANPYAFTKFVGEEYCRMYNKIWKVPVAITRFFNVYGKRHNRRAKYATVIASFEEQMIQNNLLKIYGDGSKRRDFTHVEDIVIGLYLASSKEWNGDIFNFGKGKNYSIKELAHMFTDDKNIKYLSERKGEAQETLANIFETKGKLGWIPQRDLTIYVEYFLERLSYARKQFHGDVNSIRKYMEETD